MWLITASDKDLALNEGRQRNDGALQTGMTVGVQSEYSNNKADFNLKPCRAITRIKQIWWDELINLSELAVATHSEQNQEKQFDTTIKSR